MDNTNRCFFLWTALYKNSTDCAKNCTAKLKILMRVFYQMIEYSSKRRVLKWPNSQLLVDTSLEALYPTNPWGAYTILHKVAAYHSTQPKIASHLAWYVIKTPSNFQLLKRPSAWAVSLARRGTFLHGAIIFSCGGLGHFLMLKKHCAISCTQAPAG